LTPIDFDATITGTPVAVGSTLFFTASDASHGNELWKSDGTAASTVMVKDINPGSGASSPMYLTAVGGTLFFSATDGVHGPELWKSEGTAAGTVMVNDI
jgi:ELWxxDGT repeat protein